MKDFGQGPKPMPRSLSPQPAMHPSANPARSRPPVRAGAVLHQAWGNAGVAPSFCHGLRKPRKCNTARSTSALFCCRYHGRRAGNGRLHRGHPLPAPHLAPDLQAETSRQQQTYVPLPCQPPAETPISSPRPASAWPLWDGTCPAGISWFGCPESHGHCVRWPKDRSLPGASCKAVLGRAGHACRLSVRSVG